MTSRTPLKNRVADLGSFEDFLVVNNIIMNIYTKFQLVATFFEVRTYMRRIMFKSWKIGRHTSIISISQSEVSDRSKYCFFFIIQVQVWINNVPSKCTGDFDTDASTSCGFEWTSDATPTVTSISPSSGSKDTVLTISGMQISPMILSIKTPLRNPKLY